MEDIVPDDPVMVYTTKPSLKNLTSPEWSEPMEAPNKALKSLGEPHVESFNFMLKDGLKWAVEDIEPLAFSIPDLGTEYRVSLNISECHILPPIVAPGTFNVTEHRVFPTEARQRGSSYKGLCTIKFEYSINGVPQAGQETTLGNIPIMIKSNACNLRKMSPAELIKHGEQETEWGGYFIIGGHERIIRMLQTTRRNYPIAMSRPSWKNRGKNFSEMGVLLECGKKDLTTTKNVLHFVTTRTAKFMFSFGKELFFVPVIMILKCLSNRTDSGIYEELMVGIDPEDHYYKGCMRNILNEPQEEGLFSPDQVSPTNTHMINH